ncbi:DUF2249 domain-containing protein [Rehaibacterium terrae]|jgi:TusA-related sulfurtransferase|uniref:TusA-related sulfurtransferase n=1 Tax=Rehaibacterium terrae TaxID=1341696 RepID=A0A7W7Y1M5_9GAMM|nr:DUF2249 domain-containing protein [Rehaibacterium terrae]MBB5016415.1 TusA-related sulfurtransferase [Rehaibacterium terrae]
MDEIKLDLRHLPAPEPLIRILEALEALAPGQSLRAITPCRQPLPLLEILDARACVYDLLDAEGGGGQIRIRHRDDGAGD